MKEGKTTGELKAKGRGAEGYSEGATQEELILTTLEGPGV